MKKIFSFILFAGMAASLSATVVDKETARRKAEQLLGKGMVEAKAFTAGARPDHPKAETEAYYLFNAADGKGFAIISAENDLAEVLGYSESGNFVSMQDAPEALLLFLDAYQQYVDAYHQGKASAPSMVKRAASNIEIQPLVSTQWGQATPYNDLCPMLNDQHTLAGCVATATAQIMKYWQWPVQGQGYGTAECNGNVVHGTLEHAYQWNAMLNTTLENYQSQEASAAVAELLYDCGLAVNMSYGLSGSSAGTPIKAFYANFGYIPTTLRIYRRDCVDGDEEWLDRIINELVHGRPVYYSASSSVNGGNDTAGHAFVIDGCRDGNFLHVNWGWNGDCDGFYALTSLSPGSYNFSLNNSIITGIEPAMNGETGVPVEYPYMGQKPTSDHSGTINKSVDFSISVGDIWNFNGNTHSWSISVGLFDTTGKMLGEVKKRGGNTIGSITLESSTGYRGSMGSITCNLSSKTLTNGHYALRVIFKENSGWILPDMAGGLKNNGVYIQVNGSKFTFTDGTAYNEELEASDIISIAASHSSDNGVYDLQGRKIVSPRKGLYIQNGRKVVIK